MLFLQPVKASKKHSWCVWTTPLYVCLNAQLRGVPFHLMVIKSIFFFYNIIRGSLVGWLPPLCLDEPDQACMFSWKLSISAGWYLWFIETQKNSKKKTFKVSSRLLMENGKMIRAGESSTEETVWHFIVLERAVNSSDKMPLTNGPCSGTNSFLHFFTRVNSTLSINTQHEIVLAEKIFSPC